MLRPASDHTAGTLPALVNGAANDAPPPQVMDLREIVRALRRRSKVIAATTIALVLGCIIFIAVATPYYTATSTVLVDPRRANVVDSNNQPPPSSFGSDDATVESQVMLI